MGRHERGHLICVWIEIVVLHALLASLCRFLQMCPRTCVCERLCDRETSTRSRLPEPLPGLSGSQTGKTGARSSIDRRQIFEKLIAVAERKINCWTLISFRHIYALELSLPINFPVRPGPSIVRLPIERSPISVSSIGTKLDFPVRPGPSIIRLSIERSPISVLPIDTK